jgi:hypothetical protein
VIFFNQSGRIPHQFDHAVGAANRETCAAALQSASNDRERGAIAGGSGSLIGDDLNGEILDGF